MKKHLFLFSALFVALTAQAGVDMQASVASDEGRAAYTAYVSKQQSYYSGNYTYASLVLQSYNQLYGSLNTLMGNTSRIGSSSFSYNSLRNEYVDVDRDLNKPGNIIGYYDGRSMSGVWDSGNTWNREHTWPQSKGADKSIPMGHDMQSVRPASTKVNGDRGNTAYGETGSFYDPNEIAISNSNYKASNHGSYRGDCARVILYDYLVYGQQGGYQNNLYNGNAQLLSKLGASGVFESIEILLKWHMQDPPSLTEMVRNDGAQAYQGNRNPFIDYPEFAISILQNQVQTYAVTSNATMTPNYTLTTRHGFVTYFTAPDGTHPTNVTVTGATGNYEPALGRLTVTNVTAAMQVTSNMPDAVENTQQPILAYAYDHTLFVRFMQTAQPLNLQVYNLAGAVLYNAPLTEDLALPLAPGVYLLRLGEQATKVMVP